MPSGNNVVQPSNTPTEINLPGDNNTLIAHADSVNNQYNPVFVFNNGTSGTPPMAAQQITFNSDYYNLIVIAGDVLDGTGRVMIDKERAITESTSEELKDLYASLTPEAIATIKTFPAIITTENHSYGKTDAQHFADYGMITDIKVQDNGIKVYYQCLNKIPQQRLNELLFELGLQGNEHFNELNRMHWAIKKIDMVQVLKENGIQVFSDRKSVV